ncbi:unnamed protein product [Allacma fusca]|uniref:Uncharacterized protein n=1 Tax=Allacma fusca TaxID=39272 RepID=A0A8J2KCH4_9HEXA|nr:unnamed protein product [Allacma fusca]
MMGKTNSEKIQDPKEEWLLNGLAPLMNLLNEKWSPNYADFAEFLDTPAKLWKPEGSSNSDVQSAEPPENNPYSHCVISLIMNAAERPTIDIRTPLHDYNNFY